ncbi:MAG: LysM peptidoglycan-binding domain-containing protein [Candidatus Riflebacteria bacterium]|nr:LysM peptidoglycan-binding domain-containing protein [Candidatus Riflebacteria bacterium]
MLTKLKARHYSILVLFAIVSLETSAIAVDHLFSRGNNTAFEVSGAFQNNSLINSFKLAEANAAPAPARLTQLPAIRRDAMAAASLAATRPASVIPPSITIAGPEVPPKSGSEISGKASLPPAGVNAIAALPALDRWVDYPVNKGDSLAAIAGQFGTTADQIAKANGLTDSKSLKAGQKIRIPATSAKLMYAVREGDTLSRISSKFGLAIQDIIRANNLKDHFLAEGQKIEIPVHVSGNKLEMVKSEACASAGPALKSLEKLGGSPRLGGHQELALVKSNTPAIVTASPSVAANTLPTSAPNSVASVADAKKVPVITPVASKPVRMASIQSAPVSESVKTVKPVSAAASAVVPQNSDDMKIVAHVVKNGDSLATVARQYNTSISQILSSNTLSNSALKPGQQIKVPVNKRFYRVMQVTSRRADVSTRMTMPCHGRMTDLYGWRMHPVYHRRLFHAGIDLAAPRGSPINAAMPGVVVYAGWMSGYGKLVVIRHPNGLSTRYGHCSSIRVSKGQSVRGGQIIACVGSTGSATGNHLHFEVRREGRPMNPAVALGWR